MPVIVISGGSREKLWVNKYNISLFNLLVNFFNTYTAFDKKFESLWQPQTDLDLLASIYSYQ